MQKQLGDVAGDQAALVLIGCALQVKQGANAKLGAVACAAEGAPEALWPAPSPDRLLAPIIRSVPLLKLRHRHAWQKLDSVHRHGALFAVDRSSASAGSPNGELALPMRRFVPNQVSACGALAREQFQRTVSSASCLRSVFFGSDDPTAAGRERLLMAGCRY